MSILTLHVTSSHAQVGSERRFDKGNTIISIKEKLEMIVGSSAAHMRLEVYGEGDRKVCDLGNDDAMLGAYPVENYMRLHVVDTNPHRQLGEFDDVSKVEKQDMTQEEYETRTDSVLAFKKKHKMGRFADDYEEQMAAKEKAEEEEASKITVGSRCEVTVKSAGARRGVVRFVGKTEFKEGWWIGVEYDEPLGKNNGSVGGKSYFKCQDKYGGFARAKDVAVGDFPPEDEDFSDMEM